MIQITNPKVAGFTPRWAPFRGFSLLWDNPGSGLTRSGTLLHLTADVDADPALGFYRSLRDSLDELDRNVLTNAFLFCPLPPPSYHVTLWDGLNDANGTQVHAAHRQPAEAFLAGLPDSLAGPYEWLRLAAESPLAARRDWELELRFDRLSKWGDSVLVAQLAPMEESLETFDRIVQARRALSEQSRERFGFSPPERYTPHVSLGYFANQEAAGLAMPHVEVWNGRFAERLAGRTLTLRHAAVYGFTDMGSFFKTGA